MTTLHQIGELLRSGVRPTEEETEDLKSLGGFVAEMYGRFMGGHAEHLTSAADLWSGRLAGRLSAATGARWEQGIGLAELLLGNELTSFWQIAREGLSAGYDGLDMAEMGMVDLYEEDAPEPVEAAAEEAAPQRRRGSLFGARGKAPSVVRKALRPVAARRPEGRQQLTTVGLESEATPGAERDGSQPQRDTRWRDGSRAEMSVIRALAAGGLFVGDQVVDVAPRGAAQLAARGVSAQGAATPNGAGQRSFELGGAARRPAGLMPVFLDGLRIDGRTPALASALARVDAVFGRGAKAAADGAAAAAVSQSRLGRLTATTDYSIDRGFGTGERPVYGFYDAAETTYLNLQNEVASVAGSTPEAEVQVPRAMRARAARTMPASVQALRQREVARGQAAAREPGAVAARPQVATQAGPTQYAKVHAVSLDQVVDARGGVLKPFVGGVFANRATGTGAQASRAAESIALAGQVSHTPAGEPTVRVHRGGMSAPRYSVLEAAQVASPAGRSYDFSGAEALPFVAGGAASFIAGTSRGVESVFAAEAARVAGAGQSVGAGQIAGGTRSTTQVAGAQVAERAGITMSAAEAMSPVARVLGRGREIGGGFSLGTSGAMAGTSTVVEQGANAAAAPGRTTSGAGWRLAIDGGSDLPLGATFSRYEAFAGGRASQAAADMRATRSEFRPVIAGGGAERPSELAQAVDGLVWVTLPNEATPVQVPSTDDMGLAAVPSRRAAMVPAGLAFQSIAGVVAGARHAAVSAQPGRGLVVGPRGEVLVSGEVGAASNEGFAGSVGRTPVSGVTSAAVAGAVGQARLNAELAAGAQRVEGGFERELGVSSIGAQAERSFAGGSYGGAAFAQALRSGFLGNVEASGARAAQLGSVQSPALAAVAARGEAEGSMGGRWVEASLRGNALERGLRAARFLDGMVGEGNYGRIESERQLLAMVREPTVAEPVNGQELGAEAPRAGRLAARRLAPVAVGRTGGVQSMLGRVEMKPPAAVRAQQPGLPVVGAMAQRALVAGAAAAGRGVAPVGAPDMRLSDARVALSRGVVTARESRAVAAMYQSLTQSTQAPGAAQRPMVTGLAQSAQVGSDEPVLGRIVQRMNAMRAEQPLTAARWDVPSDLAERVSKLEGADRTNVQRALRLAGWSEPELKMLEIAKPEGMAREAAQVDGAVAATAERRDVARAPTSVAAIAQSARASRMGRSLARVVAGAEALGATVSDKQVGASASTIAQNQASSWLPLLGTGADAKYFGGLAPGKAGANAQVSPMREALGALVKMAEAAVAASDSPVALAAHREVLRRASELKGKASVAGDRATLTRIMEVAAQSEQMRLVSPDSPTGVVDALGERVSGMLGDGAQIKGFEDVITSLSSTVDGPKIGTGYANVAQREMRVMDAERTMLGLASEPGAGDAPAGLEARLAKALALSTSGPAGARRMMRGAVLPKGEATKAAVPTTAGRKSLWNREPDEAAMLKDTVMNGRSPDAQVRSSLVAQQLGALREEMSRGVSVMLNSILAPEAMLGGLRSPELSEAIRAVVVRRLRLGDEFTPVLTTLADSGVDLTAARSSLSSQVQVEIAKRMKAASSSESTIGGVGVKLDEMAGEKLAFKPIGPESDQFRVNKSVLAGEAAEHELVSLLSESGDVAGQLSASSGMSRRTRAGMLSSILRGTERAEMTALLEQVGGREFAMAWLNRVDGSRSGIDIGMKGTRQEFGQTFGVRRNSAVASDSPIRDVNYVNTAAAEGGAGGGAEDRSGLRSIAAEMVHTSTGAARPQHGASQAMRRTDWSFVDTGSRASTSHADLGKLAASLVGSADTTTRASMPLIAPAVKAVAQTALRDPTTSSNVSNNTSSGGSAPSSSGSRGPVDAKMSEKAIEMLAIEMANRVARLMGLTNERRGIWS